MLAGLMPDDAQGKAEVFGLLALREIQASRLPVRIGQDGALIPLTEQSRARWDQLLIRRGREALARAEALGRQMRDGDDGRREDGDHGPYVLQAALAACHARAQPGRH